MIIIDGFLSPQVRHEVLVDGLFFPEPMGGGDRIATEINSYHYEKSDCYAPFMFWDGWWRSPANTLKKRVIKEIWEGKIPFNLDDILGIEYWTRTYLAGQYLDIHVDEDTFLYAESKVFAGPAIGAIYYGVDNDQGGFLEIHPAKLVDGTPLAIERDEMMEVAAPIEMRERIAYKGDRLIIFDAGHTPHASVQAISGIRQVMVCNVWHKDRPPTALKLGEFYYE